MWRGGKPQDDFVFSAISDYLVEDETLVWCDIYEPDHATLADLAQELGLNSWAVEDAVAEAERTKAAVYRTHTFFTVYAVSVTEPADDSESALEIAPHLRVRAAAGADHGAAVAAFRHRHRVTAL